MADEPSVPVNIEPPKPAPLDPMSRDELERIRNRNPQREPLSPREYVRLMRQADDTPDTLT